MNGQMKGEGRQSYIYRLEDNNMVKYFKDGRKFYEMRFDGHFAYGRHLCGEDVYMAEYEFVDDDQFKLRYIIKGPKKDMVIETEFMKV